jgi:hypothetical protein
MLRALCKRRAIRIKYERFANAQVAAAIWNVHRTSEDQPTVTAFDWVRDAEESSKREQLLNYKRIINDAVRQTPVTAPRSKFLEVRRTVIAKLTEQGCENAEQMFDEKWPSLKPQEGEK